MCFISTPVTYDIVPLSAITTRERCNFCVNEFETGVMP
jgi:hypothetical protein